MLPDKAWAVIEIRLGESFKETPQHIVFLLLIIQPGGVEAYVPEHVVQLLAVRLFDSLQRPVDAFTVSGLLAFIIKEIEAGFFWQNETPDFRLPIHQFRMVAIFSF